MKITTNYKQLWHVINYVSYFTIKIILKQQQQQQQQQQ